MTLCSVTAIIELVKNTPGEWERDSLADGKREVGLSTHQHLVARFKERRFSKNKTVLVSTISPWDLLTGTNSPNLGRGGWSASGKHLSC